MQKGDVVLTPVPQADGTVKNRPAIGLREMPVYRDVLVYGVSTQLYQYVPGFDDLIPPADADFAASGLIAPSLNRLGFLAVVPQRNIPGTIGATAPERHKCLLQALSNYLLRNVGS
jgi:mRNA interferase MazF